MRLRTVAIASTLVAAAGSALAWPFLGDRVPIHWNVDGQADGFAAKSVAALAGPLLVLALWALFELTARVDPRRPGLRRGGRELIYKVQLPFIAALHLTLLAVLTGLVESGSKLAVGLVGLLFVVFGNFMGKLRPNWFAGVRTPWTLDNDEVWRRTNRLAARFFVGGGLAVVALAFPLSGHALAIGLVAVTAVVALVPAAYSYVLHRQFARDVSAS